MAGKTEWEDMLIKLGHMEAPPQEEKVDLWKIDTPPDNDKLDTVTIEDLDEFEDDEDEKVLEAYRKKRLAEMQQAAIRNKFGEVINITEPEWKAEVTNAPPNIFVVVNLYKQGVPQSRLLDQHLALLAPKHKAVKFVRIRAEEAIHGYPDRNCPTILVYNKGDVVAQMVTLAPLAGDATTAEDIEWRLAKLNILETELEEDPKEKRGRKKGPPIASYVGRQDRNTDEHDDDDGEGDDDDY